MTNNFFAFEADFIESLRCIPMLVRMKLDTCGVKLKLSHWHQLNEQERQTLVSMSCQTQAESQLYKQFLQDLLTNKTGAPAGELPIDDYPAWLNGTTIPDEVQAKAAEFGVNMAIAHWVVLTPAQRFALIKLSRPSHENKNFYPALQEFKLA